MTYNSGPPDALHVAPVLSLHRALQEQLRRYILTSGLKPGDRLPPESVLARRTGASRNAVREALRGLEALGLVEVQHGSGWFVRPFDLDRVIGGLSYSLVVDADSLAELLEVRAALEEAFLPRAMATLQPADLQRLRAAVDAMASRVAAGTPFAEEDMAFHRILFSRCGNHVLSRLLELFWGLFMNALDLAMMRSERPQQTVVFHKGICDAVERGDLAAAQGLLRQHFEDVRDRLTTRRRPSPPAGSPRE